MRGKVLHQSIQYFHKYVAVSHFIKPIYTSLFLLNVSLIIFNQMTDQLFQIEPFKIRNLQCFPLPTPRLVMSCIFAPS